VQCVSGQNACLSQGSGLSQRPGAARLGESMHNRAAGPRTLKDATLASYSTADNTSWTTPPPNQHRLLCFSFPPPLAAHLLLLRPPSHSKHDATARYRVGPLIHLAALNTRISPSINLSSRLFRTQSLAPFIISLRSDHRRHRPDKETPPVWCLDRGYRRWHGAGRACPRARSSGGDLVLTSSHFIVRFAGDALGWDQG
jgi:hypothetical protein